MIKMKNVNLMVTFAILNVSMAFGAGDWPKVIETDKAKVTVYQPQLDSLVGDVLYGMAAIAYASGEDQPVFGAIWFASTITTDRSTRRTAIESVNIFEMRFPEDSGFNDKVDLERASEFFTKEVPGWELEFSLDELVTGLEVKAADQNTGFNDEAPEIIYATVPTVLVLLDGDAQWQSVTSDVDRVVNTPALVFRYNQKHYILGNGMWYESATTTDWTNIKSPPKAVSKAVGELLTKEAQQQLKDESTGTVVNIEVRTTPAELVQTSGDADMVPITGTNLLYVTNSESDILFDINRQQYYLLISGRWFVGSSLQGPWDFLPPTQLPEDFAKIPEGNEKDGVLSNVPGTDANKEALMDAQVPQTAAIDRETATTDVQYDGKPEFSKIEDTNLEYAENSDKQVIKENGRFYCVDDGIWYVSESPDGPWFASTTRPDDVDKIPASSSVHNVKYVYIYDYTPTYVYCGYIPAYTGCYIHYGVPVYGTGWYYRPWYRTYYYPRPCTWGFSMSYNPWYGFSMGMHYSVGGPYFNFSIHFGSAGYRGPYRGYYGGYFGCPGWRPPYHPPYGGWYGSRGPTININNPTININNKNVINNINRNNNYGNMYGNKSWGGNEKLGNRPSTREAKRPGVAQTGARPATADGKMRPGASRPTPSAPSTRPSTGGNRRPSTGGVSPSIDKSTRPERPSTPSTRPAQPSQPATRPSTKQQPTTPGNSRDIYSDRSGKTYERSSNNWNSTRPGSSPSTQPANRGSYNGRDLNNDSRSRQRAQQRSNSYQSRPKAQPRAGGARGRRG